MGETENTYPYSFGKVTAIDIFTLRVAEVAIELKSRQKKKDEG
jgi:hypothetical protein